ncbi:MAG: NAD(P)H oxidoreductase [Gammaproteobacteria bacterium]|nr:MAG: NAD(P)H oxidoreductase [Gammaproteobacteria bacterium]
MDLPEHSVPKNILILFAHPMIHRSNVNRALVHAASQLDNVTVHDLYAAYPDFYIDVKYEQELLIEHDVIIFQHPFYWYSSPPMLKMWQDLVLQYGFAYGSEGTALKNKEFMSVITAGASKSTYESDGINRYTIDELLRPTEQMAYFTGMHYLPPHVIYGTHRIRARDIILSVKAYRQLLTRLRDEPIHHEEKQHTDIWAALLSLLTGQRND